MMKRTMAVPVLAMCVVLVGCKVASEPGPTDNAVPTFKAVELQSADDMAGLRAAAEAGQPEAMFLLGREYLIGRYVTQDSAEAMVWFERSASAGSSAGANAMGVMYYEALGIEQDYEMAMALFYAAVEADGNTRAMRNLGRMYEGGHGTPVDYAEALRWYEAALKSAGDNEHLKATLVEAIERVKTAEQPEIPSGDGEFIYFQF